MTRLWLCMVALWATVGFLSCDSGTSTPGGTGGSVTDGTGPSGGTSGSAGAGAGGTTGSDGAGPAGGRGGTGGTGGALAGRGGNNGSAASDGGGPTGGRGGNNGTGASDGFGPVGGRGGNNGTGASDGFGPVGGRGGNNGCPAAACDGTGPIAGRGGGGGKGGAGGTGGALQPCDGLAYFTQRGWCAATYVQQAAKNVPGNCDYVRVFTGSCGGQQIWTTRYQGLGDPITCGYDSTGTLAGARTCTDTPMSQWNCNGASTSPSCLNAGTLPDVNACTLTTSCAAAGGRGGGSGP